MGLHVNNEAGCEQFEPQRTLAVGECVVSLKTRVSHIREPSVYVCPSPAPEKKGVGPLYYPVHFSRTQSPLVFSFVRQSAYQLSFSAICHDRGESCPVIVPNAVLAGSVFGPAKFV